jgi:hypothetical protein
VNTAVVVSLSKVKKTKLRASSKAQASANSVKFGLTKLERALDRARAEKLAQTLDGAKRT